MIALMFVVVVEVGPVRWGTQSTVGVCTRDIYGGAPAASGGVVRGTVRESAWKSLAKGKNLDRVLSWREEKSERN